MRIKTGGWTALAAMTGLTAILLFIAARIEIDYFDVFNTLSNAKTIALGQGPYEIRRFLFPAVLAAPWFLLESWLGAEGLAFRATHLMSVLFFVAWLSLIFRVYRRGFGTEGSLGGVCALASVPLLLHYVPSAKEDLLSALLIWAALSTYLSGRFVTAGVFSGLAMASRYNLLVLLSGFFVAHTLIAKRDRREPAIIIGTALGLFAALPLFVYPYIGHTGVVNAIPLFFRELYALFLHHATGYQPYYVYFQFFLLVVGLPYCLLAVWGIVDKMRRRAPDPELEFHAAWLLINMVYHAFFQAGIELRYLFPILPSVIFLAMAGLRALPRPALRLAAVVFLVAYGGTRATQELLKFRDPFYYTPFERQVSLRAKDLANGNRIFWMGRYYGLHPREAVYHPDDHFTYLYHFHTHVVRFYSGRPVHPLMGGDFLLPDNQRKWVSMPGVGEFAQDGEVFIVNIDPQNNFTEDMTPTMPPLYLQRVRLHSTLAGMKDGIYEWYGRADAKAPWAFFALVNVANEKITSSLQMAPPKESRFLTYDVVETFGMTPDSLLENEKHGPDYAKARKEMIPAESFL